VRDKGESRLEDPALGEVTRITFHIPAATPMALARGRLAARPEL
jgi:hypothetical protein